MRIERNEQRLAIRRPLRIVGDAGSGQLDLPNGNPVTGHQTYFWGF
jgi:hypothetical protein